MLYNLKTTSDPTLKETVVFILFIDLFLEFSSDSLIKPLLELL